MGTDIKKGKKFVELAKPDKEGKSEWIDVVNLPQDYEELKVTNGCSWARNKSWLQEKYNVEKRYNGKKLTHIKLNGFKND